MKNSNFKNAGFTPTLDFENVYYMKELQQFNLFSISQICDKKNIVLFTDTDCLVLSKDFMLLDESMVVFRVPRKHNLYTINLNNLSPRGNLACIVAKVSVDESVKWHRRMGHVNYKNMNRLVKVEPRSVAQALEDPSWVDAMQEEMQQFKYIVPTGRVVVPAGRYIVPAGKVILIVSTARLSLVPTSRILSP
ncbi:putative ribonuclease H-like domain-containing protein, partial [Tanacetum coccineum]